MPWSFMPWPFDRTYMQLALLAGVVVGATAPLIGVFLVQKGLSLMGDGIGHVAVAGIGASLLLDTSPTWTALVVAIAAALVIEFLRTRGSATGDLALALVFYGGIAGGVVLASRSGTNTNLQPYLFGSILTATADDVWTVIGLGAVIAIAIAFTGRALLAVVLDEDSARVAGIPARSLNAMLAVLTAVDGLDAGTDELDAVLLQDAGRVQRHRRVERGLPAQGREQCVGALLLDHLLDELGRDRLDVRRVRELRVGHDRRRVGVDQDHPDALGHQHPARLGAGVVELAGLADDDRAAADDHDRRDVVALGHYASSPSAPGFRDACCASSSTTGGLPVVEEGALAPVSKPRKSVIRSTKRSKR